MVLPLANTPHPHPPTTLSATHLGLLCGISIIAGHWSTAEGFRAVPHSKLTSFTLMEWGPLVLQLRRVTPDDQWRGAVHETSTRDRVKFFIQTKNFTTSTALCTVARSTVSPITTTKSLSITPPLCLTSSSTPGRGPIFNHNERGEHAALRRTQMRPQRVPDQFLLDKGKSDAHGGDETQADG